MGEERLHHRLRVVERALDRDRMDVRGVDGGHLTPLHGGDALVRVEDEDVDARRPREGRDRRAARVAGGRAHDGGALAARLPTAWSIIRPRSCMADVLEGERRAVEELLHEEVVVDLDERAGRGVTEGLGTIPRSCGRARQARIHHRRARRGRPRQLPRRVGRRSPRSSCVRAPARHAARRARRRGRGRRASLP
jgi:hypothetical protein